MPQDAEEFANEMKEWSRWKHEILDKYLGAFAGILQRHQTVYFVDGFAGAGKYDDGSEGSAIRSARLAARIEANNARKYLLRCINIEENDQVFSTLESNLKDYGDLVLNLHGSFSDYVESIVTKIGEQPTLFFLDPFGVKGLEWESLLPIFTRRPSRSSYIVTELLMRFDVRAVSLMAGHFGRNSSSSASNQKRLLDIFGLSSAEDWHKLIQQTGENPLGLVEAYCNRLREHFDFAVRMPVRRTDTGQLKYYLIFATRHEKAVSEMNKVLYQVDAMRDFEVYDDAKATGQLELFDIKENTILNELETLKKLIMQKLNIGESISRSSLVTRIATTGDYFGAFSDKHFTAVLGGRPRNFTIPSEFVSLKDRINLKGTPSQGKTIIHRIAE